MTVAFTPRRLRDALLGIAAALTVLTACALVAEFGTPGSAAAHVLERFDASREGSVGTYFSALLLLWCAVLAAAVALTQGARPERYRTRWVLLAAALAFLSLDEAAALHESTIRPLQRILDAGGPLRYNWILPGSVAIALMIAAFRPPIAAMPRSLARMAGIGVVLFVVGALGFEVYEGWIADSAGERAPGLIPLYVIEEALEMAGAILFAHGLASLVAGESGALRLGVSGAGGAPATRRPGQPAPPPAALLVRPAQRQGERASARAGTGRPPAS
jgi:hypothetical protein